MPANKRTSKAALNRNASDPFIIYLEDEQYELTEENLKKQVDVGVQKKRNWVYPTIKFLSFKNKVLKLRTSNSEDSFEITVKIEPDKLHISCSCGSPVQTLCSHAYHTIDKLISFQRTDYFESYSPKGLIEIALANRKFFKAKPNNSGLYITPADTLGNIYKIVDRMYNFNFQNVLNLPQESVEQEMVRLTDLTYIILYSSRDKYLPFLLPCVGVLNKAGNDIKGFYNFITGPLNEYDAYLTYEQKELNSLCLDMLETKNQNGSIITCDIVQTSYAGKIIDLWNKAIPLLLHQQFVYLYDFYHKVELKNKPRKARLQRISLSRQRPHLYFQLADKGAFYQLQLHVSVQGKSLKNFDTVSTFFVFKDKILYLLTSLKDAGIAEWMRRCDNCITIFKEHFAEFKDEFLTPLTSHYRVETIPFKK